MSSAEGFIEAYDGDQYEILSFLHDYLSELPEVVSKMRYRVPFYFRNSWVCYLNPKKDGAVDLCFLRANEMLIEEGLLDMKDRKQVGSITYYAKSDINLGILDQLINEALLLDETLPYKSKRSK